jgi:hypothetical protein
MTEQISADGRLLALIVRAKDVLPTETTFLTPKDLGLQLGYIVYPAGAEIPRHVHRPIDRHLTGTGEVLVVQKGRCLLDVYDDDRRLIETTELATGDAMLMVGGGHGFRLLEDTVLLEIKQGPYTGLDEKERF